MKKLVGGSWKDFVLGDQSICVYVYVKIPVRIISCNFLLLGQGHHGWQGTKTPRPGPCLDFGFQYALIRNLSKKFGIEYKALPGSNLPWCPCR